VLKQIKFDGHIIYVLTGSNLTPWILCCIKNCLRTLKSVE